MDGWTVVRFLHVLGIAALEALSMTVLAISVVIVLLGVELAH